MRQIRLFLRLPLSQLTVPPLTYSLFGVSHKADAHMKDVGCHTQASRMPASAHYHTAPAHLMPVSTTVAADAFLAATFPKQLGPPGGVKKKHHHHHQHSYATGATARPRRGNGDFFAVESDREEGPVGGEEDDEVRDCVIVGGGIAGLAAAADLERGGLDFVLLEAGMFVGR